MTLSSAGVAFIEQFEKLELTAYADLGGVPTIGYGHCRGVKLSDTCTAAQADAWLEQDCAEAEAAVNRCVRIPLTQNQFDALTSFTFNCGVAAFGGSTMLRLLNSGNPRLASAEFPKWDHVAGVVTPGLLRRRLAEQSLFCSVSA